MGAPVNAKHAKVIDTVEGTLPSGLYAGQSVRMELRESNDGKIRFVVVRIGTDFRRSYQYSGRNFGSAARQVEDMREALKTK